MKIYGTYVLNVLVQLCSTWARVLQSSRTFEECYFQTICFKICHLKRKCAVHVTFSDEVDFWSLKYYKLGMNDMHKLKREFNPNNNETIAKGETFLDYMDGDRDKLPNHQ